MKVVHSTACKAAAPVRVLVQGITHKLKWNQTIRGAAGGLVPGDGAGSSMLSDEGKATASSSSSSRHSRNGNGRSSEMGGNGTKVSILPPMASDVAESRY
jgi:hypothetical protein